MKTHRDLATGTLIATLPGDLTSTTTEQLRTEFNALLDPLAQAKADWKTFRLELPAAKMVDSVGLNLIVSLLKMVRQHGAQMQIACGNPNVHRTFLFTRLDKHLELIKL
jgi:anti-anti-sigma factor